MSLRTLIKQSAGPLLLALLVMACGAPGWIPLATSTPLPATPAPTAEPTTLPPTATLAPPPPTAIAAPTLQPQAEVIVAWHEALNNKDIDAFMALLADDAALDRGPHGIITGTENIRALVVHEMEQGIQAKVSGFHVLGDEVTYHYETYLGGKRVDQGTGVAIVRGGKIVSDLPAK